MVKSFFIAFFLWLPAILLSAEFTASVNRNHVQQDESLALSLTLKGASAQATPDISPLKNSFHINSQHQSSSATFTNGHLTSSTTWKISLTPKTDGEATIPSINLPTTEGLLSSQPITIRTSKDKAEGQGSSDTQGMTLITEASLAKPFKNEPVFYTLRLTTKSDVANVSLHKFTIDDAIVESNGEPKAYKKIIDGIQINAIEFSFLITPLKSGPLIIPSLVIQGGIPIKRPPQRGSFFDDNFDQMFIMPGFERLKPFKVSSNETTLDVQPAVPGLSPWLPAKSLRIEEIWDDSQTFQTGEPITREYKIVAEGILSSQLPNLNDQHNTNHDFKIYADKPETGDEIKDGNIQSFRKERYTLIPQQAGELTLPEISIAWWDVINNKKAMSRLPSRTLQILPGSSVANNTIPFPDSPSDNTAASHSLAVPRDPFIYAIMACLAVLLLAAVFWVIALQRKIQKLSESRIALKKDVPSPTPAKHVSAKTAELAKKDKKEKLPDLNPT